MTKSSSASLCPGIVSRSLSLSSSSVKWGNSHSAHKPGLSELRLCRSGLQEVFPGVLAQRLKAYFWF